MLVDELLTFFKANKTPNKNDSINNVHKPYEAFRYIFPDYVSLDVTTLLTNIDDFYNKAMVPNYRPNTIKNYLRDLQWSLDLNIINTNVPEDIIQNARTKIKSYIQQADKAANEVKKAPSSTTATSTATSEEEEKSELNIDINEILPTGADADGEDETDDDDSSEEQEPPNLHYAQTDKLMTNYIILQTENEMLRDQVAWLRSLVESITACPGTRLRRPGHDH